MPTESPLRRLERAIRMIDNSPPSLQRAQMALRADLLRKAEALRREEMARRFGRAA